MAPLPSRYLHTIYRRVVLVLLGTKVFPSPSTLDIIMDLAAHSEPFLKVAQTHLRIKHTIFSQGQAHAGMAAGTRNLMKMAVPRVAEQLEANPGYSLLIIGYSLGRQLL